MPYGSCHAVSTKSGHDAAGALNAALASATRTLDREVRQAESSLDEFTVSGVSHSHSMSLTSDGTTRAVVTAIACYHYR